MSSGDKTKATSSSESSKRATQDEEEASSSGSGDTVPYDHEQDMGNQPVQPVKNVAPIAHRGPTAKTVRPAAAKAAVPKRPIVTKVAAPRLPANPRQTRSTREDESSDEEASRDSRTSSRDDSRSVSVSRSDRTNAPAANKSKAVNQTTVKTTKPSSAPVKKEHAKKEPAKKRRDESDDDESSRGSRSSSRSDRDRKKKGDKKKSKKKAFDKVIDERERYATLTVQDLGTTTFYVLPKPTETYLIVREPETIEVFNNVQHPSDAWCPITTLTTRQDAESFCRKANYEAYRRKEFRTPYPERGYVWYEIRHGEVDPWSAEEFVDHHAQYFQKLRNAYNRKMHDEEARRREQSNDRRR